MQLLLKDVPFSSSISCKVGGNIQGNDGTVPVIVFVQLYGKSGVNIRKLGNGSTIGIN